MTSIQPQIHTDLKQVLNTAIIIQLNFTPQTQQNDTVHNSWPNTQSNITKNPKPVQEFCVAGLFQSTSKDFQESVKWKINVKT